MKLIKDTPTYKHPIKKYLASIVLLLLSFISISYAAGFLPGGLITSLKQFAAGEAISSTDVNQNFTKINQELLDLKTALNNVVPVGTLITYSGAAVPAGYAKCPTTSDAAIVSRTDPKYAALYAVIGTTWGSISVATFAIPWFPEGYTLLQADQSQTNGIVGKQSVGEVIQHTHTTNAVVANSGGGTYSGSNGNFSAASIGNTGGASNLAAGAKVLILVKL